MHQIKGRMGALLLPLHFALKQGLLVLKPPQVLLPLIYVLTFIQQSESAHSNSSARVYFWLSPEAFRTWLYKPQLQLPAKGLRKSLLDSLSSLCPEPVPSFALCKI